MSKPRIPPRESALVRRRPVGRYQTAAAISILGLIYGAWRWATGG